MSFNLRNYPEQSGAIFDHSRYEVGITLQRLAEQPDGPFFIRYMGTNQIAEVVTEQSIPLFEEKLRRAFHLENFVGIVPVADQQESSNG